MTPYLVIEISIPLFKVQLNYLGISQADISGMKVHVGIEVRGQIIQCLRDSFENYNFCYKWEKELLKEGNEQGDQLEGYLLL